jgi:hypothetical protein
MEKAFAAGRLRPNPRRFACDVTPIQSIVGVDHNTCGHWHKTENGQPENSDLVRAA